MLVFTTLGAFGRIWGAATSQVTILAATACVVMVDRPMHDLRAGIAFLGVYLVGCLFAVVLSLTVWRIHPFGASRASLRAVYLRLADIAFDSARLLEQRAAAERVGHACREISRRCARGAGALAQGAGERARVENGRPAKLTTICSAC